MKGLQDHFLNKNALYPNVYKDLVTRLTRVGDVSKSLNTDEEQTERGKAFGNVYECFMYATMIGIKAQNPLPFERGSAGTKFYQIKDWKHDNLVQYIFMSLLALADFALVDIENLTDDEAEKKATELVNSMENYAKGGFELMETKRKESPQFFESSGNIVSFLQTMKPLDN